MFIRSINGGAFTSLQPPPKADPPLAEKFSNCSRNGVLRESQKEVEMTSVLVFLVGVAMSVFLAIEVGRLFGEVIPDKLCEGEDPYELKNFLLVQSVGVAMASYVLIPSLVPFGFLWAVKMLMS